MRTPLILLLLVLVVGAGVLAVNGGLLAPTPTSTQSSTETPEDPETVAGEMFTVHFMNDMGFTPESVARKQNRLTPDLYQQISAYFARPQSPNEAPVINGDPFTNTQEYPSAFEVNEGTQQDLTTTRVPVVMTIGPDRRTVQVQLVRQSGAWLVDDLIYEDGSTFRALLKEEP
jgi:hypothetical protein